MSQEVYFKSVVTKAGKVQVSITRYGQFIYLNEADVRKLRDDLTKALRKGRKK